MIVCGILNAILYASLLPLWEGFDEPFHYAYVQELSDNGALPRLGRSALSGEVWASLRLAPASHFVQRNIPEVITFEDFFKLPHEKRVELRQRLTHLDATSSPGGLNYEAQHAPLAYIALAAPNRMWRSVDLPTRVLWLRLVCGIFASIATALSVLSLSRRLGLSQHFQACALFLTLSSQMFYATTAHVANDWLAVPLMVCLFERIVAMIQDPNRRNALSLVVILSAGLLTKAYFLALAPLVIGLMARSFLKREISWSTVALSVFLLLAIAGPWYVRNVLLYHNITGMQESVGGANLSGPLNAFCRVPWLHSLRGLLFGSLWTGNNSFTSFSTTTLTFLIIGIFACWVLLGRELFLRVLPRSERAILLGCALYGLGLFYSMALTCWASKGSAATTSSWYTQPVIPALWCLFCAVLGRSGQLGRLLASVLIFWSAYIMSLTYFGKLIPLYAGYGSGRVVFSEALSWYRQHFSSIAENLSTIALGNSLLVLGLSLLVTFGTVVLGCLLIISLNFRRMKSSL